MPIIWLWFKLLQHTCLNILESDGSVVFSDELDLVLKTDDLMSVLSQLESIKSTETEESNVMEDNIYDNEENYKVPFNWLKLMHDKFVRKRTNFFFKYGYQWF